MRELKKINVITKNWIRHGAYSGYECLVASLSSPYKFVKGVQLPYRFLKYLRDKTRILNYRTDTVSKEFLLLLYGLIRPLTVYIQYADMDYYYLHWLKRFPFNLWQHTLIATFHHPSDELNQRLGYNRKSILGALDKVIVMGPNQIPFFKPYTDADIRFIPHGINLNYFKPDASIPVKRQFLIIGISHRDHKRNLAIIEGFPEALDCKFVVVMPAKYVKHYRGLKRVDVVTENITDNQLLNYYQESAGLLLSLKDCTASNSILEALACGCPIITNRVGAVEAYIPQESGIPVFETHDIQGSIAYMEELLENEALAKAIRRTQRELAKKYDWKRIAKATEDFILQ